MHVRATHWLGRKVSLPLQCGSHMHSTEAALGSLALFSSSLGLLAHVQGWEGWYIQLTIHWIRRRVWYINILLLIGHLHAHQYWCMSHTTHVHPTEQFVNFCLHAAACTCSSLISSSKLHTGCYSNCMHCNIIYKFTVQKVCICAWAITFVDKLYLLQEYSVQDLAASVCKVESFHQDLVSRR